EKWFVPSRSTVFPDEFAICRWLAALIGVDRTGLSASRAASTLMNEFEVKISPAANTIKHTAINIMDFLIFLLLQRRASSVITMPGYVEGHAVRLHQCTRSKAGK